jgi:hypothetical protein
VHGRRATILRHPPRSTRDQRSATTQIPCAGSARYCNIDYGLATLYEAVGDAAFDSELSAIAAKSAAEYAKKKLTNGYHYDFEVPNTVQGLRQMMYWNGEKMLEWIRDAKRRTGRPPSKTGIRGDREVPD